MPPLPTYYYRLHLTRERESCQGELGSRGAESIPFVQLVANNSLVFVGTKHKHNYCKAKDN